MTEIRNPIPLPLLITGIAGVAGYNAFAYFHAKYPGQVVGTRRKNLWRLDDDGIAPCDVEDRDTLSRLFDQHGFRSVLNTVGNCRLKHCELDPQLAHRVNVIAVKNLLHTIAGRNVRLLHLSIDLVFSGKDGASGQHGYHESSPTDPVTVYGKTMVAGEQLIRADTPQAAILRISLPMGESFNGHAGAIDWIQSRFAAGKPATLYIDEIRTPAYADCLNLACERVLCSELVGTFHAGGPRALSLYQIAQIVNRVGGYDPDLLHGIPRHEAGPMPPRAGDVRLDSRALTDALGKCPFDPWPLDEEFVPTHERWHEERPPIRPARRGCFARFCIAIWQRDARCFGPAGFAWPHGGARLHPSKPRITATSKLGLASTERSASGQWSRPPLRNAVRGCRGSQ